MFIHPNYFPLYDYRNIVFNSNVLTNDIISQAVYLYLEVI